MKSKKKLEEVQQNEDEIAISKDDIDKVESKKTKKHKRKKTDAGSTDKTKDGDSLVPNEEPPKRSIIQFHEMGLDDRLLKSISQLGWTQPTLIQEKAIPLALEGKDILSRARTGSGKTAAYALPIIQRLLDKQSSLEISIVQVVALVPSKELSSQVCNMFNLLLDNCSGALTCMNVSSDNDYESKVTLNNIPNIIVGTPSKILAQLKDGNLNLDSLSWLVIDEADLLLSFGYEKDLKSLITSIPKSLQCFITSATFSDETVALKKLLLHNPVTLNLKENSLPSANQLTQYHVLCNSEDDKFLLMCALVKLNLIRGKTIIFVNSVVKCFKLKLFLERFSVFSCVLNAELPVNTRCHTLDQFNKGLYSYIIATDTTDLVSLKPKGIQKQAVKEKQEKHAQKQKEFSVSRGVDFQYVSNVLNFDFPDTVQSYIHRVGRTARGDSTGTALSFVLPEEKMLLEQAENELGNNMMRPYLFAMDQIEGLKYRCQDALHSITRGSIREARLQDMKNEILNSTKLKSYFEENPKDLQVLRHDRPLQPSQIKSHMKHVPDYLVPGVLKGVSGARRKRTAGSSYKFHGRSNQKYRKREQDPLKSLKQNKGKKKK